MGNIKVTKITDLIKANEGEVIQLPSFSENVPFVARIKRPSMMQLAAEGQIPNELLALAEKMFTGETKDSKLKTNSNVLKQMHEVMIAIANAALVEPTYEELVNAEVNLTDDQLTFIFNYAQEGVRFLNRFRAIEKNYNGN